MKTIELIKTEMRSMMVGTSFPVWHLSRKTGVSESKIRDAITKIADEPGFLVKSDNGTVSAISRTRPWPETSTTESAGPVLVENARRRAGGAP